MGSSVKEALGMALVVGLSFLAPGSQAFTWSLFAKRVVFTLVSQKLGEALAPGQEAFDNSSNGAKVSKAGTNQTIPVIYGNAIVGGTVVYMNINGVDNEYLNLVYSLCEGEIEAIEDIRINDISYLDAKYDTFVEVFPMLGSDSQLAEPNCVLNNDEWTEDHKLSGIAYCYIRFKFDADVFTGIPNVEFLVKGKKVYDPRDGLIKYSNNAALCINDYLTNSRYGRGLSQVDIDVIDSANYVDSRSYFGTCDGVVNTNATTFDNTKALLSACRGSLVYRLGSYVLMTDGGFHQPIVMDFNEDTILASGITIDIRDKKRLVNTIKCSFNDKAQDWEANTIVVKSDYAIGVDGTPLEAHISLPFTTDLMTAETIANIELNKNRLNLLVDITMPLAYIMVEVNDVIAIDYDLAGWNSKLFQVNSVEINDDEVNLTLQEYADEEYEGATGQSVFELDTAPDTDLPDMLSAAADPINITAVEEAIWVATTVWDGHYESVTVVNWEAGDDLTTAFTVEYKLTTSNTWFTTSVTAGTTVTISDLVDGKEYDIKVNALNALGVNVGQEAITMTPQGGWQFYSHSLEATTSMAATGTRELPTECHLNSSFGTSATGSLIVLAKVDLCQPPYLGTSQHPCPEFIVAATAKIAQHPSNMCSPNHTLTITPSFVTDYCSGNSAAPECPGVSYGGTWDWATITGTNFESWNGFSTDCILGHNSDQFIDISGADLYDSFVSWYLYPGESVIDNYLTVTMTDADAGDTWQAVAVSTTQINITIRNAAGFIVAKPFDFTLEGISGGNFHDGILGGTGNASIGAEMTDTFVSSTRTVSGTGYFSYSQDALSPAESIVYYPSNNIYYSTPVVTIELEAGYDYGFLSSSSGGFDLRIWPNGQGSLYGYSSHIRKEYSFTAIGAGSQ